MTDKQLIKIAQEGVGEELRRKISEGKPVSYYDIESKRVYRPEDIKYKTTIYIEEDGSATAVLDVIDLAENAPDEEEACMLLAESILDYSKEYMSDFQFHYNAPNRRPHLPFVNKAIKLGDAESIRKEMMCRNREIKGD